MWPKIEVKSNGFGMTNLVFEIKTLILIILIKPQKFI